VWLEPDKFDCSACRDHEILGHYKPAARPVPWDPPPGFYDDPPEGGFDPARFRCPKLYVTAWVDAVTEYHHAATKLHAPPHAGGTAMWPAKLRAAMTYLESQFAARRRKAEADAIAAAEARAKMR